MQILSWMDLTHFLYVPFPYVVYRKHHEMHHLITLNLINCTTDPELREFKCRDAISRRGEECHRVIIYSYLFPIIPVISHSYIL